MREEMGLDERFFTAIATDGAQRCFDAGGAIPRSPVGGGDDEGLREGEAVGAGQGAERLVEGFFPSAVAATAAVAMRDFNEIRIDQTMACLCGDGAERLIDVIHGDLAVAGVVDGHDVFNDEGCYQ